MQVKHHGLVLTPYFKELKPSLSEAERGVLRVWAFDYRCPHKNEHGEYCGRRLLYKQEEFISGCTEMMRIRPGQRTAFLHRVRMAPVSHAVQGTVQDKLSGKWRFQESIKVE